MRAFVVVSHTAPLDGDFPLEDLPGGAGRLDILCRCVVDSFLISHGIRRDVVLHLIIRGEVVVTLDGGRLRHLNPDERSTAALLRRALALVPDLPPGQALPATPGISVRRLSLPGLLEELRAQGLSPLLLLETGKPLRSFPLPPHPAFFLSDHLDFTPDELDQLGVLPAVSLAPIALHGHQCIILVHNELDLREAGWIGG